MHVRLIAGKQEPTESACERGEPVGEMIVDINEMVMEVVRIALASIVKVDRAVIISTRLLSGWRSGEESQTCSVMSFCV